MAKGWIVLGFAAGYIVGSRAGRKQFDRIKSAATDLWERPEVQNTVKKVDDFVADKVPVVHNLGAAAVDSVSSSPSDSATTPGSTTSGSATSGSATSGSTTDSSSTEPTGSTS
jgi:hypothetical protein